MNISPQLSALLDAIQRYESDDISVEALQSAVRTAEESVSEYELRDLRAFLKSAEGRLESLLFMTEGTHLQTEAGAVARSVEAEIRRVLGSDPHSGDRDG